MSRELHCYTGHWSGDAHLLSLHRDVGPYRPVVEGLPVDDIIDIIDIVNITDNRM